MPNNDNMIRLKRGQLREISPDKAKHTDVYQPPPRRVAATPVKTVDEQVAAAQANENAAKEEMGRVLKEHDELAQKMLQYETRIKELEGAAVEPAEDGDNEALEDALSKLEVAERSAKQWEDEAKLNLQNAEDAKEKLSKAVGEHEDLRREEGDLDKKLKAADSRLEDATSELEKTKKELEEATAKLALPPPEAEHVEISSIPIGKIKKIKKNKDGTRACLVCSVDYDAGTLPEGSAVTEELSIIIPMEETKKLRRVGGPKKDESEQDE